MSRKLFFGLVFVTVVLVACNEKGKGGSIRETTSKGRIRISVDESFKPVMQEQLLVHASQFPGASIDVTYQSEAACFRDLQSDSTRMIIVARGLNEAESSFFKGKIDFVPQYGILAYDAIAVIVNREFADSVFTIADIKDILSGKRPLTAVMDGKNATSTVRYLQDSVMRGTAFGKNVVAAESSRKVIEVIANNKEMIGFVGLSWVGDSYDPQQKMDQKKIRTALLECVKCEEKDLFAKPTQASLAHGAYPLARPLYYVLKENTAGLGTGLMNFMSLERGQLIFRRSFLVPAKMGFNKRTSQITEVD